MINKTNARELLDTTLNEIKNKKIFPRQEIYALLKQSELKHITCLSGIRRCGKTYLLFQIIKKLIEEKKTTAYINFEDPRFNDSTEQLDILYQTILENRKEEGKIYLFLDEIQNIKKWEKWLAAMYEKNIKFYVSGSNASLLAGEFSKSLTGRHKLSRTYPLDFKQFLDFKEPSLLEEKEKRIIEKTAKIKKYLKEYLQYGGFPETIFNNRKDLMKDYFEDILTKDIITRHNLKFKQSLKEIAVILLTNISSQHSLYSLNKLIQARSINTIKNYLMYMEDAYLIQKVPFFSYSIKKQLSNPFKIYATDTGMRNAISASFSEDLGKLYENLVAIELTKKYEKENIYYWKSTKHEVDFLVKQGSKIVQLIQVCYDTSNADTKKRETEALLKASKELKCKNLLIITEDKEGQEKISGKTIKYKPLWHWLIE